MVPANTHPFARGRTGYTANSLNAMLLTPEKLSVAGCHDPDLRPILGQGRPATVDGGIEAVEEETLYFGLRYRRTDDSVVVASSASRSPSAAAGGLSRTTRSSSWTAPRWPWSRSSWTSGSPSRKPRRMP